MVVVVIVLLLSAAPLCEYLQLLPYRHVPERKKRHSAGEEEDDHSVDMSAVDRHVWMEGLGDGGAAAKRCKPS